MKRSGYVIFGKTPHGLRAATGIDISLRDRKGKVEGEREKDEKSEKRKDGEEQVSESLKGRKRNDESLRENEEGAREIGEQSKKLLLGLSFLKLNSNAYLGFSPFLNTFLL